jgi:hypothetical protein
MKLEEELTQESTDGSFAVSPSSPTSTLSEESTEATPLCTLSTETAEKTSCFTLA